MRPLMIPSLLQIKERCEEIASDIRNGFASEEDARALDVMAEQIEAHLSTTTGDRCRYALVDGGPQHGTHIVHAGDCPNPIHKEKQ